MALEMTIYNETAMKKKIMAMNGIDNGNKR